MSIITFSVLFLALTSVCESVYHYPNPRRGQRRRVRYEHFDDYLLTVIGRQQRADNDVIERLFGRETTTSTLTSTTSKTTTTSTTTENPTPHRQHHPNAHRNHRKHHENVTVTTTDDEDIVEGSGGASDESGEETVTPTTQTPTPQPDISSVGLDILGYFRDVPRQHWSCCMLGKLAGDKGFHCHAGFYAARITMRNYNRAHNRRMPLMHGPHRQPNWGRDTMFTFRRCVSRHSDEFHKCCYAAAIEKRELSRWRRIRQNNMRRNRSNSRRWHREE